MPDVHKPVLAEIESLKSSLLRYTALETDILDPSNEIVSSAQVFACNGAKKLLQEHLYDIFKLFDKMKKKDDTRAIYEELDRVVLMALIAGMHAPNDQLEKLRQDKKTARARAALPANVAARKRREMMRPLVEEVAKDFPEIHEFSSLATAINKVLMKRPEFRNLLPKNLNPRQIKGDIEAILMELDDEADLARGAGLDEGDEP